MEKNEISKRMRSPLRGWGVEFSVHIAWSEKPIVIRQHLDRDLKEREGMNHVAIQQKRISGSNSSKCECPETDSLFSLFKRQQEGQLEQRKQGGGS